jgi:DNA-binding NarL/FixJ family response regulator
MTPIRIGIAEDCGLSREGLRAVLATNPRFDVAGDADGPTDIFLIDSRIPGSVDLCRELNRAGGRPWTILFAADADDEWALRALEAGARGILTKKACVEELVKAIHLVHEGQIWARQPVVTRMAEEFAAFTGATERKRTLVTHQLSAREREVLGHAVQGLSNKEIAHRLARSEATIKAHLTHIFQKLGLRDRVQLAAHFHGAALPSTAREPRTNL